MPGVPAVSFLTVALLLFATTSPALGQSRATLPNGKFLTGRISGDSPAKLVFVSSDGKSTVPAATVRLILWNTGPVLPLSVAPLKRMTLPGGDIFTGELLSQNASEALLTFRGGTPLRIAPTLLQSVRQPPGEINVTYEDFETVPKSWSSAVGAIAIDSTHYQSGKRSLSLNSKDFDCGHELPEPVAHGRVQLSFFETTVVDPQNEWGIDFLFRTKTGDEFVRVRLGWNSQIYGLQSSRDLHFTRQQVRRTSGWRHLSLLFDGSRTLVCIDQNVLANGLAMGGELTGVRINRRPTSKPDKAVAKSKNDAPADSKAEAWVDDFKVYRTVPELPVPIDAQAPPTLPTKAKPESSEPRDLLWLLSGDELYGDVKMLTPLDIQLKGAFGERHVRWADTRGVLFRPRQNVAPHSPIQGLIARIEFRPYLFPVVDDNDRLTAAVQSVSATELQLSHHDLGTLKIPLSEVRKIEPQYLGSRWMIAPGPEHMGDEIHPDFLVPIPLGSQLSRTLKLASVPKGPLWIGLTVSQLEPAGPQTAKENPFRAELAAGFLRTELFINDKKVDYLNRYIDSRARKQNPQRIRIPVAAKNFKPGANTIRLEQRPSQSDPNNFDDFEFSQWTLEAEALH